MVCVYRHRSLLVVVVSLCIPVHTNAKDTVLYQVYIKNKITKKKVNVCQNDVKRRTKPAIVELLFWSIYIFAVLMCLIRGSTLQNDSVHTIF
jgi:hypothetical protein